MKHISQDIWFSLRSLSNAPGFTLLAVLALAIGIGANTAIFSIVNQVLLRPLPTDGLERLHVVREDLPDLDLYDAPLSPPEVLDLAAMQDSFDAVTGFQATDRTLTGFGNAQRIGVAATIGDFARVFGVQAEFGRFYGPQASTDGSPRAAVVSYGLWQQLSGGDPAFVGRTLELDGETYDVLGVMPANFRYPRDVQVWSPLAMTSQDLQNRGRLFMTAVVRTNVDSNDSQLATRLSAEAGRWNEQYNTGYAKALSSTPFVEDLAGPLRNVLFVLLAAVGFVLLLASSNVASLQLVRAANRSKDLAVRAAIGASRARIAGPLLMESALLALFGGAAGLGLGSLSLGLVERWPPAEQMNLTGVSLDLTVLIFTAIVTLLATAASGIAPALRATRIDPRAELRYSGRAASNRRDRLLRASSALQIALALVLLLGSGLMVRTLSQLLAADPGFDSTDVVTARVSIPGSAYDSPQRRALFFDELLERTRAMPGVDEASFISYVPFGGQTDSSPFSIVGEPASANDEALHAEARTISSGYFRTLGIPLLSGRDFNDSDDFGSARVVVVDENFAEQFFPGDDPIGRQIVGGHTGGNRATIVGVVGNVDHDEIGGASSLKAVTYYQHAYHALDTYTVAVRSSQPVGNVVSMLRTTLAELDPNVPLYDVQTMDGRIERSLGPRRLAMLALAGFTVLALILAALGIYGVMRCTTDQRTHEIGIRVAVGAQREDVVRLVLRQGMTIVGVGLIIGLVVSLVSMRLMRSVLFGVSPNDPATFVVATVFLAAVALAAIWLPARRATRMDPTRALRAE